VTTAARVARRLEGAIDPGVYFLHLQSPAAEDRPKLALAK
jgi:hypothetical protein